MSCTKLNMISKKVIHSELKITVYYYKVPAVNYHKCIYTIIIIIGKNILQLV